MTLSILLSYYQVMIEIKYRFNKANPGFRTTGFMYCRINTKNLIKKCERFYCEDLNEEQIIEGIEVVNPILEH